MREEGEMGREEGGGKGLRREEGGSKDEGERREEGGRWNARRGGRWQR